MSDMSSDCSSESYNVHFEYKPGKSVIKTEMRMFLEGKVYHIKEDESVDVQLSAGNHHVAFKSSILGTNMDFDVSKDTKVVLGWDSESGKITVKIN